MVRLMKGTAPLLSFNLLQREPFGFRNDPPAEDKRCQRDQRVDGKGCSGAKAIEKNRETEADNHIAEPTQSRGEAHGETANTQRIYFSNHDPEYRAETDGEESHIYEGAGDADDFQLLGAGMQKKTAG